MGNEIKKKKQTIVAVSGGFDPIHSGHLRLFEAAKKLGDKLVVILNNDNWLMAKKGFVFMKEHERKRIIEALSVIDKVAISKHVKNPKDMSVCRELKELKPDIFANGGDRSKDNVPEVPLCKKINCKMVFNVGQGGKIQSSSWLTENYKKKTSKPKLDVLYYNNYLSMIKASVNSPMFKHLYVLEKNKARDILENGRLSCAYYVSCLLKIFDLIDRPHATVKSTVESMLEFGWKKTKQLKPGNVLVWQKKEIVKGNIHSHIGFYLGNDKAISNSSFNKGVPVVHHFTYGVKNNKPQRKIIQILTHKIIK